MRQSGRGHGSEGTGFRVQMWHMLVLFTLFTVFFFVMFGTHEQQLDHRAAQAKREPRKSIADDAMPMTHPVVPDFMDPATPTKDSEKGDDSADGATPRVRGVKDEEDEDDLGVLAAAHAAAVNQSQHLASLERELRVWKRRVESLRMQKLSITREYDIAQEELRKSEDRATLLDVKLQAAESKLAKSVSKGRACSRDAQQLKIQLARVKQGSTAAANAPSDRNSASDSKNQRATATRPNAADDTGYEQDSESLTEQANATPPQLLKGLDMLLETSHPEVSIVVPVEATACEQLEQQQQQQQQRQNDDGKAQPSKCVKRVRGLLFSMLGTLEQVSIPFEVLVVTDSAAMAEKLQALHLPKGHEQLRKVYNKLVTVRHMTSVDASTTTTTTTAKETRMGWGTLCNKAMEKARARHVLFVSPSVVFSRFHLRGDWLKRITGAMRPPQSSAQAHDHDDHEAPTPGLLGFKLLGFPRPGTSKGENARTASPIVYSAGVEYAMAPEFLVQQAGGAATGMGWHSYKGRQLLQARNLPGSVAAVGMRDLLPVPYHRLSGFNFRDRRAGMAQADVAGVSSALFVVSRHVFHLVGGFNTQYASLDGQMEVLDFALKVRTQTEHSVAYSPAFVGVFLDSDQTATQTQLPDRFSLLFHVGHRVVSARVKQAVDTFYAHWKALLESMVRRQYTLDDLTVVWDTYSGCSGVNVEAINFAAQLERRLPLKLVGAPDSFCRGFPEAVQQQLNRAASKRAFAQVNVWVAHKPPPSYPKFPYRGLVTVEQRPDYVIGRSMTETDAISRAWAQKSSLVDEIWLPSSFLVDVFADGGVPRNKLRVIPEPIDVNMYDPSITVPLRLPGEKLHPDNFKFLSVFKMEERKGWDLLLEAYFSEFSAKDPVSLVMHTYLYNERDARNVARVRARIQRHIDSKLGRVTQGKKLAHWEVISQEMDSTQMPRMYKAADAFVLPTRGEGFGLPLLEAMAMGLPTIATNFSGNTDFMKEDNSYLIEVEAMEPVQRGIGLVGRWARPSVTHLRTLMRRVMEQRKEAADKGERARKFVSEHLSQEAVAKTVLDRLGAIRNELQQKSHTGKSGSGNGDASVPRTSVQDDVDQAMEDARQQRGSGTKGAFDAFRARFNEERRRRQANGTPKERHDGMTTANTQQMRQKRVPDQQEPLDAFDGDDAGVDGPPQRRGRQEEPLQEEGEEEDDGWEGGEADGWE